MTLEIPGDEADALAAALRAYLAQMWSDDRPRGSVGRRRSRREQELLLSALKRVVTSSAGCRRSE